MSFSELSKWHARQHHRFMLSHFHEGVNLGPDRRPEGWYTGEGPVRVTTMNIDRVRDERARLSEEDK